MKRGFVLLLVIIVAAVAYFYSSGTKAKKKSDELLEAFKSVDSDLKKNDEKATESLSEKSKQDDTLSELKSLIVFKLQFIKQQLEKDVKISEKPWKELYPLLVNFNQKASPSEKQPILQLTPAQQPSFENWYYSYLENQPKEVQITYVNFLLYKINSN